MTGGEAVAESWSPLQNTRRYQTIIRQVILLSIGIAKRYIESTVKISMTWSANILVNLWCISTGTVGEVNFEKCRAHSPSHIV